MTIKKKKSVDKNSSFKEKKLSNKSNYVNKILTEFVIRIKIMLHVKI